MPISEVKYIVKNFRLPVELAARIDRFKDAYRREVLLTMGYNIKNTDTMRYLLTTALNTLEPKYGLTVNSKKNKSDKKDKR